MTLRFVRALLLFVTLATPALAEDGYDLWLRYRPVETHWLAHYRAVAHAIVPAGNSETIIAARDELVRGLGGMLREKLPVAAAVDRDGAILLGTPSSSPTDRFARSSAEGFGRRRLSDPQRTRGRATKSSSSRRTRISACSTARSRSCA